jgi:hypothetical protein
MLYENPCIQLDIVKTLNPTTLLQVDLGSPEHDCLEVMDEVFLSWPDLTDQPIGHQALNISQMAAPVSGMAHALLDIQ